MDLSTIYLYPTFDNVDAALEKLEAAIPLYYKLVTEKVDLEKAYHYSYQELLATDFQIDIPEKAKMISRSTKNEFGAYDKNNTVISEADYQTQLEDEKIVFDKFLDIYENKAKNEEIMDYLKSVPNPDLEKLAYMLPYTSQIAVKQQQMGEIAPSAAQTFNKEKGIDYAIKWAYNYNTAQYPNYSLQGGDCANFASQILIAGGIQEHDYYPDTERGWWHRAIKVNNPNRPYEHYTSTSWKNADRFTRFMGTHSNVYSSFVTFSNKVQKGDFIALDTSRDGDWDHVGFVTNTGSYGTYPYRYNNQVYDRAYRNFCVAQHSKDYHAWVNSAANSWEVADIQGNTANFAIVRRNAVA